MFVAVLCPPFTLMQRGQWNIMQVKFLLLDAKAIVIDLVTLATVFLKWRLFGHMTACIPILNHSIAWDKARKAEQPDLCNFSLMHTLQKMDLY